MRDLIENKLVRSDEHGIEHSMRRAIQRAAGANDEAELLRLVKQIGELVTTAKATNDTELGEAVSRLLNDARAAARGAVLVPVIERKSAVALDLRRGSAFEYKRSASGEMAFSGYASTFNGQPDSYGDLIDPGAFAASLARHKAKGTLPKLFWMHHPSMVPGKWTEMYEDRHGLVAKGALANTQLGTELDTLIRMGAVGALSIGFSIPAGGATFNRAGNRVLTKIDLHEVSLVSLPANENATLGESFSASRGTDSFMTALNDLKRLVEQEDAKETARKRGTLIDFPSADDDLENDPEIVAALNRLNQISRKLRVK